MLNRVSAPLVARKRVQRPGRTLPIEQQSGYQMLAAATGVEEQP